MQRIINIQIKYNKSKNLLNNIKFFIHKHCIAIFIFILF